jgi:hypothetical protein
LSRPHISRTTDSGYRVMWCCARGDAVEMRWRCGGDAVEMWWRCGGDAV